MCNLGLDVRRENRPRPENATKLHSALRDEIAKDSRYQALGWSKAVNLPYVTRSQ